MFDENGDRRGLTQIEQLQEGSEVTVGVYDPSIDKANRIVWDEDHRIVWSGKKGQRSPAHEWVSALCSTNS